MKIWSLPKYETLTTGKNYCGKEKKLLLSNFSSFPEYFQYISNFKSPITHIFVKCGYSNYFILNSSNLMCRGTDISKYFRESIGIRDNESRLYEAKVIVSDFFSFQKSLPLETKKFTRIDEFEVFWKPWIVQRYYLFYVYAGDLNRSARRVCLLSLDPV